MWSIPSLRDVDNNGSSTTSSSTQPSQGGAIQSTGGASGTPGAPARPILRAVRHRQQNPNVQAAANIQPQQPAVQQVRT